MLYWGFVADARCCGWATAADMTIKVWHARTGEHEHTLEGHIAGVSDVDWAPDSLTLVSGSDDKTVRIWDALSVCFRGCWGIGDGS